jgi:hypothetical protein
LVSDNTGGVDAAQMVNDPLIATSTSPNADLTPTANGGYSLSSDAQPYWADLQARRPVVRHSHPQPRRQRLRRSRVDRPRQASAVGAAGVTFPKASGFEDRHAGYSDPVDD